MDQFMFLSILNATFSPNAHFIDILQLEIQGVRVLESPISASSSRGASGSLPRRRPTRSPSPPNTTAAL
ncbi:unnamed protein product [Trifolium pratense]|uniref:Uncharacterized protein n=1 Tax=Trifolium pratense TaxID=57577 RepID=A0ACB0LRB1_TRIPR|nr:unnamed protein product [Trifolium pratense]